MFRFRINVKPRNVRSWLNPWMRDRLNGRPRPKKTTQRQKSTHMQPHLKCFNHDTLSSFSFYISIYFFQFSHVCTGLIRVICGMSVRNFRSLYYLKSYNESPANSEIVSYNRPWPLPPNHFRFAVRT